MAKPDFDFFKFLLHPKPDYFAISSMSNSVIPKLPILKLSLNIFACEVDFFFVKMKLSFLSACHFLEHDLT